MLQKDISTQSDEEIIECLNNKYGNSVFNLVNTINSNLKDPLMTKYLKVWSIPFLFKKVESFIANQIDEPLKKFQNSLDELCDLFKELKSLKNINSLLEHTQEGNENKDNYTIEKDTGVHYGKLFENFSYSQFKEAQKLLESRIRRNGIPIDSIKNKIILDQGCGGGRYTIALKMLGAKKVIGLDFSKIGIENAISRCKHYGIKNVEFIEGSVLKMPFEDNIFDFVFSNGVLHHTNNWTLGLREQLRVLKKGGMGFLYLIENPGGIFWDSVEILRFLNKNTNKSFARNTLATLGIPNNRIFYMLDHVLVPINTRLKPEEIENQLIKEKANNIRRLKRGTDFDRVEYLYKGKSNGYDLFGVGENRYIFTK